jgi:hypothetical protein
MNLNPGKCQISGIRCVSTDRFIFFVDDIRIKEKFPYNLEAMVWEFPIIHVI